MKVAISGATASELRDRLGEGFAFSIADRIEDELGVDVIVMDMVGSGYSLQVAGKTVILAQRTAVWGRQNFTIAHELGHLALGSLCDGAAPHTEGEEGANRFAAQLLAPRSEILKVSWNQVSCSEVAEHLWRWGITTPALKVRLRSERVECPIHLAQALELSTPAFLRRHLVRDDVGNLIADREKLSASQRFPSELIDRLTQEVNQGTAPPASLAFALGVSVGDLEIDPPDIFDPGVEDLLDDLD